MDATTPTIYVGAGNPAGTLSVKPSQPRFSFKVEMQGIGISACDSSTTWNLDFCMGALD